MLSANLNSVTAPFGTTEDRYIKAIQSRVVDSNSRKVVHHALSFAVDPDDTSEMGDDSGGGGGQFLVEYASGKNATFYQPDAGVLLKAGQNARLEYHFHSIGEEVDAKVELGIVFYPKGFVPKHVQWSKQLGQEAAPDLDIPPNSIVRRDGYTRLNTAAHITAKPIAARASTAPSLVKRSPNSHTLRTMLTIGSTITRNGWEARSGPTCSAA